MQGGSMKLGVLFSRVRVEEKWLFEALDKRGVDYDKIDDREAIFDSTQVEKWQNYDAVLERSISFARGLYATQILNA
jgi:[lysine-biosynthesis-protein LysW]--L-2-aminoadipate ligase